MVSVTMRLGLRQGVLFRSAEALQRAYKADVVAFDKTGTLSQGVFSVERTEMIVAGSEKVILPLIADNKHPISRAIALHLKDFMSPGNVALSDVTSLPGMGIKASLAGYPLLGGSPKFTGSLEHHVVKECIAAGYTLFTVTLAGQLIAVFGLADVARPESAALIAELAHRGKKVLLLSGDNNGAVERFARSVSLPFESVRAACSPADKARIIADFQSQGKSVCFVGDGTNDSAALAQADVSLSLASGSEIAIVASGAVLLGSDLKRSVIGALDLASSAHLHIILALGWCVLYAVMAILLASGAFVKFRIEPQWAGLGEVVSVLPVVGVGMAMDLRWRWKGRGMGNKSSK